MPIIHGHLAYTTSDSFAYNVVAIENYVTFWRMIQ